MGRFTSALTNLTGVSITGPGAAGVSTTSCGWVSDGSAWTQQGVPRLGEQSIRYHARSGLTPLTERISPAAATPTAPYWIAGPVRMVMSRRTRIARIGVLSTGPSYGGGVYGLAGDRKSVGEGKRVGVGGGRSHEEKNGRE